MNLKNKFRYQYTVIRAAIPEIPVALRGGEVSEDRMQDRLKSRLEAKGLEYQPPEKN